MKTGLIYGMMLLLVIVAGMSLPGRRIRISEDADRVRYSFQGANIHFSKEERIDDVYMVYGFKTRDSMIANGYLALVPLLKARALLSQYPDMDKCTRACDEAVRSALEHTLLIYDVNAPDIADKAKKLRKVQESTSYRICLYLKGTALRKIYAEKDSKVLDIRTGGANYIYLSDMQRVSCNRSLR